MKQPIQLFSFQAQNLFTDMRRFSLLNYSMDDITSIKVSFIFENSITSVLSVFRGIL